MTSEPPPFLPLAMKTAVVHTVTYFAAGVAASAGLNYADALARPDMVCWMRQINDPVLMAGPLFQPLRGLVFALVLYPLRDLIFARPRGWLLFWWLLVGLGMIGTFGAAPGSFEGLVFSVIPIRLQLVGYLEIVPQALLLSFGVVYWVNHPEKRWLTSLMTIAFALAMALPIIGLLAKSRAV